MAKYNCGICGKAFETIQERNQCEAACLQKEQAEKDRLAKENKQKIRDSLMKKIADSIEATHDLIRDYRDVTGEEPPVTYYIECSTDYFNDPIKAVAGLHAYDVEEDDEDDDEDGLVQKFFDWLLSLYE